VSVAVVVPCLSRLHIATATKDSLRAFYLGGLAVSVREGCSDLPKSRSVITCEVLREHDAILWWDGDVTASDPACVIRWAMTNRHAEQVSVGLYRRKGGQLGLAAHGVPDPVPSLPFDVSSAGAGCMLIPRAVADLVGDGLPECIDQRERRYRPLFRSLIEPPFELSEDVSFCKRCRDAGIPIVADPSIGLGHVRSDGETIDWWAHKCAA
jgi:hypothetical protein